MKKYVSLNFRPRPAQRLILDALDRHRFVTAVCHRRLGKTWTALAWLVRSGLTHNLPNYRGYFFSTTQKQAKLTAWDPLKYIVGPLIAEGLATPHESELRLDLPNDGKIYLGSGEVIDNYRGIYIDKVALDELASWGNADYAYNEVLRPAMADRRASGLIIGTVRGLDRFFEFYQRGLSQEHPQWASLNFKASETGVILEEELADMRSSMPPDAYDREMENNFWAETPDVLITPRDVRSAIGRDVDPAWVRSSSMRIGVDVGETTDSSGATIRQGPKILDQIFWPGLNNMDVAARVAHIIEEWRPRLLPGAVCIDHGAGAGVISRLDQLGYGDFLTSVDFGGASPEAHCINMRAYMYAQLKKWLHTASISEDLPYLHQLTQDLTNLYLDEDPHRRIKLVSKRKIRAIIGRSTDYGDSLALTFAHGAEEASLAPEMLSFAKRHSLDLVSIQQAMASAPQREYDPLDYHNREDNPVEGWG